MNWLLKSLLGPGVWAATFTAVYALHGTGCALGWSEGATAPWTLHHGAMFAAWMAGILAGIFVIRMLPAGGGLQHRLPRAGAWIGLASTVFSLLPVLFASTC